MNKYECDPCPYGSYSYKYEQNSKCLDCPVEANECQMNQTSLKNGYWRESIYSTTILSCPIGTCDGGIAVSDNLCKQGSSGPLCAVCIEDYYYRFFVFH